MKKSHEEDTGETSDGTEAEIASLQKRMEFLESMLSEPLRGFVLGTPAMIGQQLPMTVLSLGGQRPLRAGHKGMMAKAFRKIRFEKKKWSMSEPDAAGCITYEAKVDGAQVWIDDIMGQKETFKAKKNGKVKVCGLVAHVGEDVEEQ